MSFFKGGSGRRFFGLDVLGCCNPCTGVTTEVTIKGGSAPVDTNSPESSPEETKKLVVALSAANQKKNVYSYLGPKPKGEPRSLTNPSSKPKKKSCCS